MISPSLMHRWVCCLVALGVLSQSTLWGQLTFMSGVELAGETSARETSVPELEIEEYVSASYANAATQAMANTGLVLRLRPTWSPNSFVKLDLDISYHRAGSESGNWVLGGDTLAAYQVRSQRWSMSPGLTLSMGERRFSPYIRIGWLVPQNYSVVYQTTELQQGRWVGQDFEVNIHTFHGLSASLGAQYRLAPRLRLYYEIGYQHQVAWIEAIEVTRYEVDGTDELDLLATYQVKAKFQEIWGDAPNQPSQDGFDPDRPLEVEQRAQSNSSLRLSLGIVWVIAR